MMKHFAILIALLMTLSSPVAAQSLDKGHAFAKADDYAAALNEWKPLAEQGNAEAQYLLGFLFRHGEHRQFDLWLLLSNVKVKRKLKTVQNKLKVAEEKRRQFEKRKEERMWEKVFKQEEKKMKKEE